jgi:hypothetical protein
VHDPENLRVLCGAHNRRRGEETFGRRCRRKSSDAEAGASSGRGTSVAMHAPEP